MTCSSSFIPRVLRADPGAWRGTLRKIAQIVAGSPGMYRDEAGVQINRRRCRIAYWKNRERCMSKFAIRLLTLATVRGGAGHGARRHHGLRRARRVAAAAIVGQGQEEEVQRSQTRHRGHRIRQRVIARPTPRSMTAATMRRDSAVEGARPRRQRRRRQPDRLLLSQARRLQGRADLVRARAEGGSRATSRPGSITVCGRSNRATATAQHHLNRIAALTGTGSEEYRSLAAALEQPPGTGLVY